MSLKRLLDGPILVAPGVYDAFSAAFAADAGFKALYLSGASVAYSQLGRPDIGLVGLDMLAALLERIAERVEIPIIADADTGFGNAVHVRHTVRRLERAGAAAIQLEDQTFPKRCGHLKDKSVIAAGDMVGKIKAALDARRSAGTLIVARTDAAATDGLDAALDRARLYAEAGADILFVEAPKNRDELGRIAAGLQGAAPLLANMVEGGQTPPLPAADLAALGYRLVIFPGGLARAFAHMARDYFASLAAHGTTAPFMERMVDFAELNRLLGTEAILARGKRYEEGEP